MASLNNFLKVTGIVTVILSSQFVTAKSVLAATEPTQFINILSKVSSALFQVTDVPAAEVRCDQTKTTLTVFIPPDNGGPDRSQGSGTR